MANSGLQICDNVFYCLDRHGKEYYLGVRGDLVRVLVACGPRD